MMIGCLVANLRKSMFNIFSKFCCDNFIYLIRDLCLTMYQFANSILVVVSQVYTKGGKENVGCDLNIVENINSTHPTL